MRNDLTGDLLGGLNELMVVFIDILLQSVGGVRLQLSNMMAQTFQVVNISMRLLAHNCTTQISTDQLNREL